MVMTDERLEVFMQTELEEKIPKLMHLFDLYSLDEMPTFRLADAHYLETMQVLPEEDRHIPEDPELFTSDVWFEDNIIAVNRAHMYPYDMGCLIGEYLHQLVNPEVEGQSQQACAEGASIAGSYGAMDVSKPFTNLTAFVKHYCGLTLNEDQRTPIRVSQHLHQDIIDA